MDPLIYLSVTVSNQLANHQFFAVDECNRTFQAFQLHMVAAATFVALENNAQLPVNVEWSEQ